MAQERADSTAFRAAQTEALVDFTNATRAALAAAIVVDDANLEAHIAERIATFDAFLDAQWAQLDADMNACREEFRLRLKEIYNYNSYDIADTVAQLSPAAPYTHEQHKSFLQKFHYFLKDTLAGYDAELAGMESAFAVRVAQRTEEADDQRASISAAFTDAGDERERVALRFGEELAEAYDDTQRDELEILTDTEAAFEAAAVAEAERLRLEVVYSMHVLRYAGGKDLGGYSFGHYASSYYGKGNALTGIDELDLYRHETEYGYAQVQDKDAVSSSTAHTDDGHHDALVEQLEGAKLGFDAMIAACRADYAAHTADEKAESQNRMDQAIADLDAHIAAATAANASDDAAYTAVFGGDNHGRQLNFNSWSNAIHDDFVARANAEHDKIEGWFNDKLEWVAKLYDSDYKNHLVAELNARRDSACADIDARIATAGAIRDAAQASLAANLAALEAQLRAHFDAEQANWNGDMAEDRAVAVARMTATRDTFAAGADALEAKKNAFADALVEEWAYWLKFIFGYQGYHTSLYYNYEDITDYGLGYDTESPNGFGYGGSAGLDYLHHEEGTGLAYGKETGPDESYFPTTATSQFGTKGFKANYSLQYINGDLWAGW